METPTGGTGFGSTTGSTTSTGSMNNSGVSNTGSEGANCPTCGQSTSGSKGLEQFLGRLGITEEMVSNIRSSIANVEVDQYLNTARDYLKDSSGKATSYAKENPGKVAAGVAVLAVGAGLLISAMNKDKE
jgi:hypothetical protein